MPSFKVNISRALADLYNGLQSSSIWMALGWNDIRTRYHRSKLGVFWTSLSILIFVSALGPIYAHLMRVELRDYILHLLLGIMLWGYISSIILECGQGFTNDSNYLVSFRMSYFTLLFRIVWRNLIVFCYQILVFIVLAFLLKLPVQISWLMALPAILFITITTLWMGLLMSVFATRFRDLSELANNILRLVFFITPIMWMPDLNPDLMWVAELNPFYHLIEIFRGPLLTGEVHTFSWQIVAIMCVVGWLIALPLFALFRSRIAFWL